MRPLNAGGILDLETYNSNPGVNVISYWRSRVLVMLSSILKMSVRGASINFSILYQPAITLYQFGLQESLSPEGALVSQKRLNE